jgi:AcrR family transcriptional regulator
MVDKSVRDRILDTALALAGRISWESVRLHDVAAELKMSLNDVRAEFREKEELTDAWFDRADAAMLQEATGPDFPGLFPRARLHRLIMAWLMALAPHRRVTRQMICGKFEPGHIHYQYAGLLRVSRTVQWLREAAQRDAVLPWRAIEEAALTAIYLAAFFCWMRDDSEQAARTSAFLDRLLSRAEQLAPWMPGFPGARNRTAAAHSVAHTGKT